MNFFAKLYPNINVKNKLLALVLLAFSPAILLPADTGMQNPVTSGDIIGHYLQATQGHEDEQRGASVQVDIHASVPKLQENGRLQAMRMISRVGRISYRVLGFQGSNTVKNQIIARYLQAEQQGQSNLKLAIIPANYKFKAKGERKTMAGENVYVFALTPRHSGVGLFRGKMWLDSRTYLPVFEKGRLVKNPSIFFKRVDFERAYSIQNGRAVPQSMSSVISTRIVGKVNLDVNYSNYAQNTDTGHESGVSLSLANWSGR